MKDLNLFIDPDSTLGKVGMKFSVINHQLLLHKLTHIQLTFFPTRPPFCFISSADGVVHR